MNAVFAGNVAYSVLDVASVAEGATPAEAFRNSLDLARHAEQLGYTRFWLSEHHNMAGIASSSPAVLMAYLAGGTTTLRVGSGGIMLPNHAPLVVAEQLGTLASLYPGRIDLGLGRAPGTDQTTARAIRGGRFAQEQDFLRDIRQLQTYFSAANKSSAVRAIPGEGLEVPLYILGSSTDSAHLAAALGLPYAFAGHFAPGQLYAALAIYHREFRPSATLAAPYAMACVNVVAADTDAEAQYLATTLQQLMVHSVTGQNRLMPPPVESMDRVWSPEVKQYVQQMLALSFVGSPTTLHQQLSAFLAQSRVQELIVSGTVFHHEARLHSFRLLAETMQQLNQPQPVEALAR